MGIKITTDDKPVRVRRNDRGEKPSYYLAFGKKEGDNWVNAYQPVRFRTGVELQNGTEIYIRHAFPTVASWVKDEKQYTRQVWMITEFDYAGQQEVQQSFDDMSEGFSAVEDDIPF